MEMKGLLFQLMTFFALIGFIASTQDPENTVQRLFMVNELTLDFSESSNEWIIQTEPNHIFYFSFLTNDDDVNEQLISSSLTIVDVNNPDSLLFPSGINQLSPFYSTDNVVSIKFKASSNLNPFRLKLEKAVSCPFNIGGSTSCGRVVDELSCYCGLFAAKTWENTKAYCKYYNMDFLSIESYEEDLGVFTAFGGYDILWIGGSDVTSEGAFVWDTTGKRVSPGYMSWAPGYPLSICASNTSDCMAYTIDNGLPAWVDFNCTSNYGGICELQPSSSSRSIKPVEIDLEKELLFDLSGPSDEWSLTTDPNHIFYFSFITPDSINEKQKDQILSSLTIVDVNKKDSLLFPSGTNQLSPFYSTDNSVSVKFVNPSQFTNLNGFLLKAQKAVPCPFNLGGSSSCGRVVDELSCYCGLFTARTWTQTKDFCKGNNMSFVAIETYEEDLALFNAFGGSETIWIGLSETVGEGTFIWDSTGKRLSPGYQAWYPGEPTSDCSGDYYACVYYGGTFPGWVDGLCGYAIGGICELQPQL